MGNAMADRGRKPGFTMSSEHRDKIRNSNILSALIAHAEGTRDMGATQVTAALGLLKKALPDLSSVSIGGDDELGPIKNVLEVSWKSDDSESS
jgi:hypothetical protein